MPATLTIGRYLDEDEITEEYKEMDVYTVPISFEELSEAIKDLSNVRFKPDKQVSSLVKFRFEYLQVFLTKEFGEPIDKDDWYSIFSWDEVDGTISFNARTTTTMDSDDVIWSIAKHIANATKANIVDDDGGILYYGKSPDNK